MNFDNNTFTQFDNNTLTRFAIITNFFDVNEKTYNSVDSKKHMYLAVVKNNIQVVQKNWFGRLLMKLGCSNASLSKVVRFMASRAVSNQINLIKEFSPVSSPASYAIAFISKILCADPFLYKLSKKIIKIFISIYSSEMEKFRKQIFKPGEMPPYADLNGFNQSNDDSLAIECIIISSLRGRSFDKLNMTLDDSRISLADRFTIAKTVMTDLRFPNALKEKALTIMQSYFS